MTHNQLQAACHLWLWNTYPDLRYLAHANINNLTTETPDARIQMSKLKAIGLVKGVFDYELYYRGVLYAFDFKIGSDRLHPDQLAYQNQIERQGGKCFEIRNFEDFKKIIYEILA
jgi:penicillin-binding protein-related factor A (putative recombinase)